jgi:hypothetical protein
MVAVEAKMHQVIDVIDVLWTTPLFSARTSLAEGYYMRAF